MHDFYASHLGHIPTTTHASSVTPPHQIHNPTPSYPTPHSSISTLNSPSPYHHHTSPPTVTSSLLSEPHSHSHSNRNESPNSAQHYNNSMNLPPTPNSLVTMIGPNSNNSNSNEATNAPVDSMDTMSSPTSISQNNSHNNSNNNPYSPWNNSIGGNGGIAIRPPLSPDGSGSLLQPLTNGVNSQMHQISAAPLQHANQVSSFMQQSLYPFSHHTPVAKNFGMAPQYHNGWY